MHPLQTLIITADFFGRNFAFNLGFLSEEQLVFKPSPTANNALEITQGAVRHLLNMKAALTGGHFGDVPVEVPNSRNEAKELVLRASGEYAEWLTTLDTGNFDEPVQLPFGTMSRGQCVVMPVLDLVHHHGQITYIQTIVGDTQSHFHSMTMA